ncbi:hypothetical protein G3N95_24590 [Paraburkholderia sp. Tr-20389]|uniref:hypothetical protein n=1 Tax=Paraburkholderia sp. Tr-20389 TaxID=2703903 RepID=UPI00197F41B6|nr:hypothetical protein [Paraburkholderia sp. Tr-20389]MBN3756141.1 hypothetical protein [Paraburkholderia sp. Tr-20389]
MEFLLLAAIFFTSAGFLIGGAAEKTPTATVAPAPASGAEGETKVPQLRLQLPGLDAAHVQQDSGSQSRT